MPVLNAVLLSLVAGLATGLGGLLVALFGELNMRTYDGLIGFAAGVMTAIATLGLIHEGITQGGVLVAALGVLVGAGMLFGLDRLLPHQHVPVDCTNPVAYRRGMLLLAAMTLHNVPEGLAVGTSDAAQPRLDCSWRWLLHCTTFPKGSQWQGLFATAGCLDGATSPGRPSQV